MWKSSQQNLTPINDKKKNTSPETGHRGNPRQHNTGYTQQMSGNIILNGYKLKAPPLRSGTR